MEFYLVIADYNGHLFLAAEIRYLSIAITKILLEKKKHQQTFQVTINKLIQEYSS